MLTEEGMRIYGENHTEFGLLCGDHYISSYKTGVLMIMSINLKFDSHVQKHKFWDTCAEHKLKFNKDI